LTKTTTLLKPGLLKQRRFVFIRSPANISILGLLIMLPVTLWVTENPQKTLTEVSLLLVGIGVFYLISSLCYSAEILRKLVALYVLAGLMIIIVIPAGVNWYLRPQPAFLLNVYRIIPHIKVFAIHPNTLAVSLLTFLPFCLGLLLFSAGKMRTLEWIFTSIVVLLGLGLLLFTQSVGGWTGLAVAFLLLIYLRWRRIGLLLILVICGILVSFLIFGQPVALKAFTIHEIVEPLRVRSLLWVRALYLIRDFPITGIGMGTYHQVVDALYPLFNYPPESILYPHPHNVYLQIAVDLGLPGLAAWLFLLINTLFAAWQIYCTGRERCDPWLIGLGAGLLVSQVGLMIHGLVDNVVLAFWPVWGLAIGCWHLLFQNEVTFPRQVVNPHT
jgi:putative inorganic carbon (hco3(-)) transporter